MSDGSLRCCANNCIHNEFYECRAGAIVVGGHKATSTKGTFCESFVDKGESILTDFVDGGYTSIDNISVKATTEEGLGFTGTKQGISAQSICLLNKK